MNKPVSEVEASAWSSVVEASEEAGLRLTVVTVTHVSPPAKLTFWKCFCCHHGNAEKAQNSFGFCESAQFGFVRSTGFDPQFTEISLVFKQNHSEEVTASAQR